MAGTRKMTEKPTADENPAEASDRAEAKPAKRKASKPKKRGTSSKSAKRNKGGRPAWAPSIADRQTVERLKFCGESEAMIARALKVDVDTLRKHCANELENGYANQRAEVTKLLFEAAHAKNVSAIKRLDEMGKVSRAAGSVGERGKPQAAAAAAPKPARLGKKEERQAAAENVGGKFKAPEPPKLVVNNQ
ncbi:hypothetical protein ACVMIH_001704 [Bradyrhizobium sp. USDA 4503]